MKIAISAQGDSLDSPFDPRFGRAAGFVIVDDETGTWSSYANPAGASGGGAGVQAARFVADHGAQAVISGDFGPNAASALAAAGIQMVLGKGQAGRAIRDLLAAYRAGQLPFADAASSGRGQRRQGRGRQS